MTTARIEHARIKNTRNQANRLKYPVLQHSKLSDNSGSSGSRKSQSRNSKNSPSTFALGTLRGLGCKGVAAPMSATVRSTAAEGAGRGRKRNPIKKSPPVDKRPTNLADTSGICCAPPGISYLSDVVPMPNMNAQRTSREQHHRVVRRSADSRDIFAPVSQRSSDIIIPIHGHQLYIRFATGTPDDDEDSHRDWRLDVDSMSYEGLLDLGDKIGYVKRGLSEEEIFHCLKASKLSAAESTNWRCSICQEVCPRDVVGRLDCGHCHHMNCIKQWLRQKNECPVCKIPSKASKVRIYP